MMHENDIGMLDSGGAVTPTASPNVWRLHEGRLHDPRLVLGLQALDHAEVCLRMSLPHAESAHVVGSRLELRRIAGTTVFERRAARSELQHPVEVEWSDGSGQSYRCYDSYSFSL